MAKVILDVEVFKALASPTRLAVLRALDERRKTVTELARDLELNKATVHEHLVLLVATGLVKKIDEGRKWVYYELSWQGERLLHPQETTSFMVMLGLSVAAAGGGVTLLARSLGLWWEGRGLSADERDLPVALPEGGPETGLDDGVGQQGAEGDRAPASPEMSEGSTATQTTQTATQTTTQSGTQTATQTTTQTATQTTTQSGTQTATQTTTQSGTQTATQTTTQSGTQSATQTTTQASTQTAGGGGAASPTSEAPVAPAGGAPDADRADDPAQMVGTEAEPAPVRTESVDVAEFPDEDGWLALALIMTAILLAVAAGIMRRAGWSRTDLDGTDAPGEAHEGQAFDGADDLDHGEGDDPDEMDGQGPGDGEQGPDDGDASVPDDAEQGSHGPGETPRDEGAEEGPDVALGDERT